jgi:hypothetical protein
MNKRTGSAASRLVTIGLPFTLTLVLVVAGHVGAGDPLPGADGGLVQYRFTVDDSQAGRWEVVLPAGLEYVGLAAGSQVVEEPEISRNRGEVVWNGPLPEGAEVRFWVAPYHAEAAPDSLSLAGRAAVAVRIEPLVHMAAEPSGGVAPAAQAATVNVTKGVDPDRLLPSDSRWVTYEVVFSNVGAGDVTLDQIVDTLPPGFLFGGMAVGSDVGEPADDTEPDIVWNLVNVPAGDSVELRYNVRAVDSAGEYSNSVVASTGGEQIGPVSARLIVDSGRLYIPLLCRNCKGQEPPTTLPFIEDFTYSSMVGWETFLNWPDLLADRWYWGGEDGVWGVYSYAYNRVVPIYEGYALEIYNGPGAQDWTDYRIEASINDVKTENQLKGLTGIWFRGMYQNSGAMDGRTVGGYYVYMKPGDDHLYLMRIPLDNPMFASQQVMASYSYGPRIGHKHWYKVVIEVRDFHIQVWFGDNDGNLKKAFDWTDPSQSWPSGTVGLAVYNTSSRFDYIHVTPLD